MSNASTFITLTVQGLSGGSGSFMRLNVTGMNVTSLTGATGMFNYLTVGKQFVSDTLIVQGLSGGSGSFMTLNVTGMNVTSLTGATGMFNHLAVGKQFVSDTLTVQGLSGGSGSFMRLNVTGMNVTSLTGATGIFNYLAVDKQFVSDTLTVQGLSGGSGSFMRLNVTGMNVTSLTGATGMFNHLSINSSGIYLGQNVGQTGAVNIGYKAGQYSQGTGSIAIGYLAGPTGMQSNSIALNASGKPLYATGPTGGFFVAPVGSYSGSTGPFTLLAYGADNQIVTVTGTVLSNMGIGGGSVSGLYVSTGGTGSIYIGTTGGPTGYANNIVLNASGTGLCTTGPTGGFFVAPVGSYSGSTGPFTLLAYGADKQIVTVIGATGLNLSLSTPTVTYDSWLLSNMINSPPPPLKIIEISQTNDYYIIFTYPTQYKFGFSNTLIPSITNAVLKIGTTSDQILTTATTTTTTTTTTTPPTTTTTTTTPTTTTTTTTTVYPYFKTTDLSTQVVECLHFYKPISTVKTTDYNDDNSNTYKTGHFLAETDNSTVFYYKNYSTSPYNQLSFIVSYKTAGSPGSQSSQTITLNVGTVTGGGIGVSSSAFIINLSSNEYYFDFTNSYIISLTKKLIDTITYSTSGTNTIRNEGIVNVAGATKVFDTVTTAPTFSIKDKIYPDTAYTFKLSSNNNSKSTTTNDVISSKTNGIDITAVSSAYITASSTSSDLFTLTLSETTAKLITAKLVSTGISTANVITTASDITGTVVYNVHNKYDNRGVSSIPTVTGISASLFKDTSNTTTPSFTLNITTTPSFTLNNTWSGSTNTWDNTNANITISPGALESYGADALSGYYAKSKLTVTVASSYITALTASASAYKISISGTYPPTNNSTGGTTSYTLTNNSNLFYWDGPLQTPTCSISSLSVNTSISPYTMMSGIRVLTGNITVTPSITVGKIGTYFYNKTKTVEYSGLIGTTTATVNKYSTTDTKETTETGLPSSYTSTAKSGTFTNDITFTKINSIYVKSLTLTATAYNINDGEKSDTYSLSLIYDTVSTLITSIPDLPLGISSTGVSGCRIYSTSLAGTGTVESSVSTTNMSTLNNFTNGGTSYSASLYKNDIAITSESPDYRKELLYTNGTYVTPATPTNYYINYGDYQGNTGLNYTGISSVSPSYRYVTFAWKVPSSIFEGAEAYNRLTFDITGATDVTISDGNAYTNYTNGTDQLFVYYRIEDSHSSKLSIATTSGKTITTYWINANAVSSSNLITTSNCYNNSSVIPSTYYTGGTESAIYTSTSTSKTLSFPKKSVGGYALSSASPPSGTVYIYLRVGVTLRSNFLFSGVTCKLLKTSDD